MVQLIKKNPSFYPIQKKFIYTHNFLQAIMGPVGSGKSVAALFKIFLYAQVIKKGSDGIRRSRFLIVRNVRKELQESTVKTYKYWFGNIGDFKETAMTDVLKFGDVECELIFLPLDRADDAGKLLSMEYTGVYFNELNQIDPFNYQTAMQRVGRYPPAEKDAQTGYQYGAFFDKERAKELGFDLDYSQDEIQMKTIIADTNPPSIGSWYHKLFEKLLFNEETGKDENPQNFTLHKQPSGLSRNAENIANLAGGYEYYMDIVKNSSDEIADVQVHAKYSIGEAGLGVFRNYFKYHEHVVEDTFSKYSKNTRLAIGMDYGLEPACVIGQWIKGQFIVFDEIYTKNTKKRALEEFLNDALLPLLREKYKYHRLDGESIVIFGDPAGNQRNQTDGRCNNDVLKKYGFKVKSGMSGLDNAINPRIESVKKLLMPLSNGGSYKMVIDKSCSHLIAGLGGSYFYMKEGKEKLIGDKPCKNTYSHIQDALQYACLHLEKFQGRYIDLNNANLYSNSNSYQGPQGSVGGY